MIVTEARQTIPTRNRGWSPVLERRADYLKTKGTNDERQYNPDPTKLTCGMSQRKAGRGGTGGFRSSPVAVMNLVHKSPYTHDLGRHYSH